MIPRYALKTKFFLCFMIFLISIRCDTPDNTPEPAADCSTVSTNFAQVNAVIQGSCTASSCHPYASTNGPGQLLTYQEIFNAREAIRTAVNNGSMPRDSRLSATQKAIIICWIDSGAPQ
jgi:hypothetical protein